MALVDFYQLAVRYKLAHGDGDSLSDLPPRSMLPPIPSYTRGMTPSAHGSSLESELSNYSSDKSEEYIVQDFDRHQVFVDIEVFMKHVLHVPDNWKKSWGPTIKTIRRDRTFMTAHAVYTSFCNTRSTKEDAFYDSLVDLTEAIFSIVGSEDSDESVKSRTRLRCIRNDGVMHGLSPDIVAIHEAKDHTHSLIDGSSMPRLKVNGKPPTFAR